jgi:hypothetical protein
MRFVNNEVRRNAYHEGAVSMSAVYNSPSSTGLVIENNLIDMTPTSSRWTVAIDLSSWNDQTFDRAIIRRNRIFMNRGRAIGVSQSIDPLVEDNLIVYRDGNYTEEAIGVPSETRGTATTGGTVRNNTIHFSGMTGGPSAMNVGFNAGTAIGAGFNITGNSVTFAGGAAATCYRVGAIARTAYMNNNHCHGGESWAQVGFHAKYGLPGWRAASSFDGASTAAAAAFVDPSGGDFTPAAGSPLLGGASRTATCTIGGVAGQPCSSPVAIGAGRWSPVEAPRRRDDGAPDIGAVER